MFGLGGSSQKSSSSSNSQSQSTMDKFGAQQSSTYLDPAQQWQQQQLAGGYLNQLNNWQQQPNDQMAGLIEQAAGPSVGYSGIGGGGGGGSLGAAPTAGIDQLNQFAQGSNPYLQQQVDNFGQDINDQFGVMQQRLGGQSAGAGQRGSSRQGIAEANSLGEYLGQYQRGVTDMRSNAYNQQQAAAGQVAGIESQNYGTQGAYAGAQAAAAASRYGSMVNAQNVAESNRLQGVQLAMQGLQQQQNMAFNPFQIGAGIIGAPSILSQSSGFDWGQSQSSSSSSSTSKGKGAGFKVTDPFSL